MAHEFHLGASHVGKASFSLDENERNRGQNESRTESDIGIPAKRNQDVLVTLHSSSVSSRCRVEDSDSLCHKVYQ